MRARAFADEAIREAQDEEQYRAPRKPLFIDMGTWDNGPPPERPWGVRNRIPLRQPTLFSGEGAIGKSLVELHLCVAHVLGRDWLGSLPEIGPAIYFGAEDEPDELRRRLTPIAEHYHATFAEMIAGGLHLVSLAGQDALLAVPDRHGKMLPTPLFTQLFDRACDIKPVHIGIDTSADVFGGNENDRTQVRQFVGLLRKPRDCRQYQRHAAEPPKPHRHQQWHRPVRNHRLAQQRARADVPNQPDHGERRRAARLRFARNEVQKEQLRSGLG